ncbi:hypothetical protein PDE_02890 [Penicillium oxalicum 114-2]|uniref:6-methylsalicylate decarboxylase n=2 Tax=Penicillium oxalicum TaxID=69781 RepID=S7ZH14_PENO1|nr:hypothetical protein PDE_02890 [Penicillium oxalicum 114-2]
MQRIDVHTHCVPPAYRAICRRNSFAGRGHPDGMPAIPPWDPESHLALMKDLGITRSILSMSSPGTHLFPGDDEQARLVTRYMNDHMADVCSQYSGKFSFFASLPLPDVEGSLAEIDRALDELGAVGFQILTNSHGVYPGDLKFRRVFEKLSQKDAIVFLHPTSCHLRREIGPVEEIEPLAGVPNPMLEFMFDSTRALTSILTSEIRTKCPGIKFIIAHCGATLPPVVARIAEFSHLISNVDGPLTVEIIKDWLQTHCYADLAGVPFPDQIHGLLRHMDSSRLLYGTDYPYTPDPLAKSLAARLDENLEREFGPETLQQALVTNAQTLFSGRWN